MKTRQFKQLAGLAGTKRADLVIPGLEAIGANVCALADEIERCNSADARRASRLLENVGTEEAGKFLVLLDVYRSPRSEATTISRQFGRAQVHLPKLIYAQIADYSIGSQDELVRALRHLRPSHRLDGPNDYDWIFRNHLILQREGSMYVDLVKTEGELQWFVPQEPGVAGFVPRPMRLVEAILATGLICAAGLTALSRSWDDFDATKDSDCWDWAARTEVALDRLSSQRMAKGDASITQFVCDRWPMPLVELDLEEEYVAIPALEGERDARYEAFMMREYGFDQ